MQGIKTLKDIDVSGKRVICRVDLNVPMKNGRVEDATRITRLVPTLNELINRKAKLIVISHFGRPDGEFVRDMSLAPLADSLSAALDGKEVKFALDCVGDLASEAVSNLKDGEVLLLENLRFHAGEESNNAKFTEDLASLGDIYVNDAFSCSHRKHASIVGLAKKLPSAAGLLLQEEIENLERVLGSSERPAAAIVGGSKVSTKLALLKSLMKKVDLLIIGGAMANTFLKAKGYKVGKSLYEEDLVETALEILKKAEDSNCEIYLPSDVVVTEEFRDFAENKIVSADRVKAKDIIIDVGPLSVAELAGKLSKYKTIVWNGPLGAFEKRPFDVGTIGLARVVSYYTSAGKMISVAGGGDVVAALSFAGLTESFSYISTAGGAFLEWLEGKELPGIDALRSR